MTQARRNSKEAALKKELRKLSMRLEQLEKHLDAYIRQKQARRQEQSTPTSVAIEDPDSAALEAFLAWGLASTSSIESAASPAKGFVKRSKEMGDDEEQQSGQQQQEEEEFPEPPSPGILSLPPLLLSTAFIGAAARGKHSGPDTASNETAAGWASHDSKQHALSWEAILSDRTIAWKLPFPEQHTSSDTSSSWPFPTSTEESDSASFFSFPTTGSLPREHEGQCFF